MDLRNQRNQYDWYLNNYGIIERNPYNNKIPVSCDYEQSIIAIGGCFDGSFTLLKGQKQIQKCFFHKKSITCIKINS